MKENKRVMVCCPIAHFPKQRNWKNKTLYFNLNLKKKMFIDIKAKE